MTLPHSVRLLCCIGFSLTLLSSWAGGEPTDPRDDEGMRFFENQIRPLLIKRCYECHSEDNSEGGFRLDVADAVSKGGDSGPAIIPGEPAASLLVSAIRYEDLEMPPDEPLSSAERLAIEKWIADGAYWPIGDLGHGAETKSDESWWAAEPIVPGEIPGEIGDSHSRSVIDRYIDAGLASAGLNRAPAAQRALLIRRLSFDLLGLPPTPEAIDAFVADRRPDAYRRLVDRMFADPAYGERMARLWLDLVRYAESDGWRADGYRPQAWRYRDFVIDAFNSGMSYDQFVSLQLAGDEIAPADDAALAAVGFLRLGIYEFNQRNAEGQWQDIVDEMTDVTADVMLATGLACAKCHDHKFDPISRADYFRFRSVFEPVLFVDRKPQPNSHLAADRVKIDQLLEELRSIEGAAVKELGEGAVDRFPLHVQAMYRKPPEKRNSYEHQIAYMVARQIIDEGLAGNKVESKIGKEANEKRQAILDQLKTLGADPYAHADLITVADAPGETRPTRLPGREKGVAFEPAAPSIFSDHSLTLARPVDAPQSSGRRSALARWITSAENPITARVMVNRLWQYHFATGLVDSPNDFGRLGSKPSHPKLLDYLAGRFIDSGWNIQLIQRLIVTSATYQQSALHPDADRAMTIDAGNRLHWHHSVRRLDAEQFRDSLLVAMGSLRNEVGGPSVEGTPPRRSVYLQRRRNSHDEMLALLDAPPGVVGTAKRDVTVTAPQSLMMLNNSRILSVARKVASRTRADVAHVDPEMRPSAFVRRAYRLVAGTEPDPNTISMLSELAANGENGEVDVCHVLLNSNAFLFVE